MVLLIALVLVPGLPASARADALFVSSNPFLDACYGAGVGLVGVALSAIAFAIGARFLAPREVEKCG